MANLLWYNEGLFVDLPHGYVDDLTQVYDSSGTIKADYFEKISGEHSKNGIYRGPVSDRHLGHRPLLIDD